MDYLPRTPHWSYSHSYHVNWAHTLPSSWKSYHNSLGVGSVGLRSSFGSSVVHLIQGDATIANYRFSTPFLARGRRKPYEVEGLRFWGSVVTKVLDCAWALPLVKFRFSLAFEAQISYKSTTISSSLVLVLPHLMGWLELGVWGCRGSERPTHFLKYYLWQYMTLSGAVKRPC